MAELVPQRGLPQEVAGLLTRARRVERHDAAETGAKRADHAGKPDGPHREVVVLREHLDQNRALRRVLVPLRHRLECFVRERDDVFLEDRRFILVQPDDEVAVADRLELVQRIEHLEHVERRDVVRIDGK